MCVLKRWWQSFAAVILTLAAPLAQADDGKEYLVKSAFMYNFVKFVEWPGDLAVSKQANFNICVIGDNPFGSAAQEIFTRASTATLKLNVVEKGNWAGNANGCHMAFISSSEQAKMTEILGALKTKPVLTVSDIDDFAKKGGVVGFTTQDNKIKLVVNTVAATGAGLRIDAQLLEIALQVIR